jgi:hypothetical protein
MNNKDKETLEHIAQVKHYLDQIAFKIQSRGLMHDQSKLTDPEVKVFRENTPEFNKVTYGSKEYEEQLKKMKPALDHHYANNRHHPEYFSNGINGMTLVDLIEMVADWKAASTRHHDGDIIKSIEINSKRFNVSEQLKNIIYNTIIWEIL